MSRATGAVHEKQTCQHEQDRVEGPLQEFPHGVHHVMVHDERGTPLRHTQACCDAREDTRNGESVLREVERGIGRHKSGDDLDDFVVLFVTILPLQTEDGDETDD